MKDQKIVNISALQDYLIEEYEFDNSSTIKKVQEAVKIAVYKELKKQGLMQSKWEVSEWL